MFYLIALVILSLHTPKTDSGRANVLNVSKDAPSPLSFWAILAAKHNTSESSTAILHNVNVVTPGPTTNGGTLDALEFGGNSNSFVQIINDGSYNGTDAMCWMFYIYYEVNQNAVLLSYEGENGGIEIRLEGDYLKAALYDIAGAYYSHTLSRSLTSSAWNCVGLNFNKLWSDDQFDLFHFPIGDSKPKSETLEMGNSVDILLDARGNIKLGQSSSGSDSFNGKMSCIQFYTTSVIGGTQKDAYAICDPTVWTSNDIVDTTEDFIPLTTTVEQTTVITSEAVTTEDATTTEQTTIKTSEAVTTSDTTTAGQTTVITSEAVTTEDVTTTEQTTVKTSEAVTTSDTTTVEQTTVLTSEAVTTTDTTTVEQTTIKTSEALTTAETTADKQTTEQTYNGMATSETTTSQQTTPAAVTSVPVTTLEITTHESTFDVQTTVMTSTLTSPASSANGTHFYSPVIQRCTDFSKYADNKHFFTPDVVTPTVSTKECVHLCIQSANCSAFSVRTSGGSIECSIGLKHYSFIDVVGYDMFVME